MLGGPIVIEYPWSIGCEVKIDEQSPGGDVTFVNEAGGTVRATFAITGIAYSWTACLSECRR